MVKRWGRFLAIMLLVAIAFGSVSCKGMDKEYVDRDVENYALWDPLVREWIKTQEGWPEGEKLDKLLAWDSWGRLIKAADEATD